MKDGQKSFNIDAPERAPVMQAVLNGEAFDLENADDTATNIWNRYQDITD